MTLPVATSCDVDSHVSATPLTREDWLKAAAAVAAVGVAATGCPTPPAPDEGPPVALSPILRRLVNRITYGLDAHEAALANELGYEGYLEYHLDYTSIDDSDVDNRLGAFRALNYTPRQLYRQSQNNFDIVFEFMWAMFVRSLHSRRQLYERMVEFWSDHFNIFISKDNVVYVKPVDDRDVIRAHALGTFPELLLASATSPAMLIYLDNTSSSYEDPNQNYAREFLELHTLGVDNFSQEDVEEVARCFTGWTVNLDFGSADVGRFYFEPGMHDSGAKVVLGRDIPEGGGIEDGERVVAIVTSEPDIAPITARFIGRKIAVQFWGYAPPEALVEEIATAYLDSGGDIRAMIRVALKQEWLEQAPDKLKRPYHYAISALRTRPSTINDYPTFSYVLQLMGNHPFFWAPPNGYPDSAGYWGTFLLPRWSYGVWLAYPNDAATYDFTPFENAASGAEFLQAVNDYVFNGALPADERAQLESYLAEDPMSIWRRYEVLSLAFAAPTFQWY